MTERMPFTPYSNKHTEFDIVLADLYVLQQL